MKKALYLLALICFLNFTSSAKQLCTECPKKCCANKAAEAKKQPAKTKKVVTTSIRPLNFYLFNI